MSALVQFLIPWVALMKDEAYPSSLSDIAECSEPHLCPKPLKVARTRENIDLNPNNANPQCTQPIGPNEGRGKRSVSFTNDSPLRENFKPASKASFANLCRKLSTSLDDQPLDHDDNILDDKLSDPNDELEHDCEPCEIPPILSKGPLGLPGYDGKPRPAQSPGHNDKSGPANLRLGPAELLGYDGKPRPPKLLGIHISDGKKSRPPRGTWAKAFKSKPRKSEKTGADMTSATRSASGSFLGKKKDQENDVFGPFTSEQSLPSPTSSIPRQPRFTRGSLRIEVIASLNDSLFIL